MRASLRCGLAATGALVVSLLFASTASASLWLILSQTSGPSGTVVTGHTGGNGAFLGPVDPLPTFFVSQAIADSVTSPDDPRLVLVGQMRVDANGDGRITFTVPSLPPGSYVLTAYCFPCAKYSIPAGRVMATVALFRITAGPPNTALAQPHSLITVLGVILLVGAVFLRFVMNVRPEGQSRYSN